MALQSSENLSDVTPIVKNTFITYEFLPTHGAPRCRSIPASLRLCQEADLNMCGSKLLVDNIPSDVSTYETDSESGTRTPMSFEGLSARSSYALPPEENMYPQNSWFLPTPALEVAPPPKPQLRGWNSEAAPFLPQEVALVQESSNPNWKNSIGEWRLIVDNTLSDISTYETGSDCGTRTPMSFGGLSAASSYASPPEVNVYPQNSWFTPTTALQVVPPPEPHTQQRGWNSEAAAYVPQEVAQIQELRTYHCKESIAEWRLNSKAAAFHPQEVAQVHAPSNQHCKKTIAERRLNSRAAASQPCEVAQVHGTHHQHYRKSIAEVIRLTTVLVKQSEHVRDVEISEDGGCWSVIIQPKIIEENSCQTELLITLAKAAILDAATKSNCIYLIGYCGPQPFTKRVQGFQATLGAMQNAATACWHVYKKGFCRHGDNCCKQHPACQVPVHFLVEGAQLQSCAHFAGMFKEQVADLALTVTTALSEHPQVERAEAFKDKDYQGWTIVLTAKEVLAFSEDHMLTLAKNAFFGATGNSDLLYIIGYAAKPFVRKSRGFVTFVGDMQDESRVCWDMYSNGFCRRGCECRFQHPEGLMPINVVVKEMSRPILPICAR